MKLNENIIWIGDPLKIFENRKLGLSESVHERYWKMQHPSCLLALGLAILSFQLNVESHSSKCKNNNTISTKQVHNHKPQPEKDQKSGFVCLFVFFMAQSTAKVMSIRSVTH